MSTEEKTWKNGGAQLSTAYLTVQSAEEAVEFYKQAFGLELGEHMNGPDGKLAHVSMTFQGTHVVMFGPEDLPWRGHSKAPKTSGDLCPVEMYLYVPDVESSRAQALEAGATVLEELKDEFWGDRTVQISDPFGYRWTLATKVGEFDPSKVPKFD